MTSALAYIVGLVRVDLLNCLFKFKFKPKLNKPSFQTGCFRQSTLSQSPPNFGNGRCLQEYKIIKPNFNPFYRRLSLKAEHVTQIRCLIVLKCKITMNKQV